MKHTDLLRNLICSLVFTGLLVAIVMTALSLPTRMSVEAAEASKTPDIPGLAQATNIQRQKLNLPVLRLDSALNQTASTKCADMAAHNYIGHNAPGGRTFDSFIQAGHPNAVRVAENLAEEYPTSAAVVAAWIASPTHYANIADSRLHSVGFAVCDTPRFHNVVVQHFSSDL